MSDEEDVADSIRDELTSRLYSAIDAGLYKRDAYDIVRLIDELIAARIRAAKENPVDPT